MISLDIDQLGFVHPNLKLLLHDLETITGFDFVSTSLYRINDEGVHGSLPLRGWDIRCFDETIGRHIASRLNLRWQYDPSRPHLSVAIYHDVGKGKHLHLQAHPMTARND